MTRKPTFTGLDIIRTKHKTPHELLMILRQLVQNRAGRASKPTVVSLDILAEIELAFIELDQHLSHGMALPPDWACRREYWDKRSDWAVGGAEGIRGKTGVKLTRKSRAKVALCQYPNCERDAMVKRTMCVRHSKASSGHEHLTSSQIARALRPEDTEASDD